MYVNIAVVIIDDVVISALVRARLGILEARTIDYNFSFESAF